MTKEEYNALLERFKKAEKWYDSNPPRAEQEKFLPHYMGIVNKINKGIMELKPNDYERWDGFKI